MKRGEIRFLWKYSALPILLVFGGMVGIGIYHQKMAIEIQKRPILTVISPETIGAVIDEELVFEQADFVDFDGEGVGPLSKASLMMREGRDEEGIRILNAYIEDQPEKIEDPRVMLALAQAYIRIEEYQLAESSLSSVPEVTGYDARILFNKALILQRVGETDKALTEYRAALKLRPTYFEAAYNLGGLLLQGGRLDEAILVLTDAVPLAGGERRARALYNLGLALGRSERYLDAREAFESAIKFAPSHMPSRMALAGLYFRNLNKPDRAESLYEETLDLDASYGPAIAGLAEIEHERGNNDLAEEYLRTSISMNPSYDRARRDLAAILSETGRIDEARRELNWIMENGSDKVEAAYQLGRIEYNAGNFDAAITYYNNSFAFSDGKHAMSLNNLGLALKAAGKLDESRAAFHNAVGIDPDYANAFYNLGLLELEDDRLPEAESAFLKSVEIDPDFAAAWYNLGLVWSTSGRNPEAMDAYEESLRIQPSNVKARLNLAVIYRREGYPERALEQYHLVLALNPSYASAWFNMGVLQKSEGDNSAAENSYRNAIDLDPDNEIYWKNLSVLYGTEDRIGDAIQVLNEALDIHPESGSLRYLLALQFKKQGDDYRALEELERCVSVAPEYAKGWIALADIQSGMNQHADAIDSLQQAKYLDPDDADTVYQLGKEYLARDETSSAIDYFQEALVSIRDNAWIWYNLGKSYQAQEKNDLAEEAYQASLLIDPSMGRFIYQRLDRVEDSLQVRRDMVEQSPTDISLRIDLALQLRRVGRSEEAIGVLLEASDAEPNNAEVLKTLGSLYVETDDRESADRSYREAYESNSSAIDIAYEYARFLVNDSRPEQAVPILNNVLLHSPSHFDILRLLGDAQYELQDYPRRLKRIGRPGKLTVNMRPSLSIWGKHTIETGNMNSPWRNSGRVYDCFLIMNGHTSGWDVH